MNFAEIEAMWRSPQNQPSAAELECRKKELIADLRRRHRRFVGFVAFVIVLLTTVTVRLALHVISPAPGASAIDPTREWGAFLFILLPWIVPVILIRQYRRHRTRHAHFVRSIPESVRALLDENRIARLRLALAAGLHGAMLVLLPLVVMQLRAVGKAGDEILVPAFVLWPLIAVAIGAALWFYDRRRLLPQKRRLEALLHADRNGE